MSFDPYAVLGVTRAATAATLKAAYRAKVQIFHPDRGGDPEAFIVLARAFGLLSDPETRQLYDATGIVDDEAVRGFRRDVATLLAEMFDTAVGSAIKAQLVLERVNFIGEMEAAVRRGVNEARTELSAAERDSKALTALRNRIRRKREGENLFAARIEEHITAREAQQATIRRRLAVLDTALVELGNYETEVALIAALETTA